MAPPPVSFLFVGNDVALDLVNTELVGESGRVDLLASEARLWEWARAAGLAPDGSPEGALEERPVDPRAPRLRAAIRALVEARIDGAAPPAGALAELNAALAAPAPPRPLRAEGAALRRDEPPPAGAADLLRRVAEAAARLLVDADAGRLRRCAGRGCILLFLDVSKTGRRRWCSMSGCGNRAKVAAHYRRRAGGAPRRRA